MSGWAALPVKVCQDPTLSPTAKAVFMALASHADKSGEAHPKGATLAEAVGVTRATIDRALEVLRERGLVTWEVRPGGRGRQRFYTVWKPGGLPHQRGNGVASSEQGGSLTHEAMGRLTSEAPIREPEPYEPEPRTRREPVAVAPVVVASDDEAALECPDMPTPPTRHLAAVDCTEVRFAEWWAVYPNHAPSRKAALASYLRAVKRGADPEVILAGLRVWEPVWESGQFVPHATTWLNQDRWEGAPTARPSQHDGPDLAAARAAVPSYMRSRRV